MVLHVDIGEVNNTVYVTPTFHMWTAYSYCDVMSAAVGRIGSVL